MMNSEKLIWESLQSMFDFRSDQLSNGYNLGESFPATTECGKQYCQA